MENKRLKILMIAGWYPYDEDPQFGVFIQKHAKAIAHFNDIAVVYVRSSQNQKEKFRENFSEGKGLIEISITFRKNNSLFGKMFFVARYFKAFRKATYLLKQKNFKADIVNSYILLRSAVAAFRYSKKNKIPFVHSEQWSGFLTGKYLHWSSIKRSIAKHVVQQADAVTCVSKVLASRMQEAGLKNKNYHVIPNVVVRPEIIQKKKVNDVVSVLLVADLVDQIKNISGVIEMISSFEMTKPFRLNIIGHGPDENKLKSLAEKSALLNKTVFFLGLKNNTEVYQHLMMCDFLIMNSRFETFSLICAEAMSCGKPVLATRCGGPDEFITTETGILIEPGNREELKEKFIYMLFHFSEYDSDKISQYAFNLFSSEEAGSKFDRIYRSLVTQ